MVTEATLERARAGDDRAFGELTDPYRGELQLHCYRILGSVQDAEDVLQETLLAAWRGLGQYEERASLRTWLYRIATNRCLNALRASGRRPRTEPPEPTFLTAEPTRRGEPLWLEPYPDVLLDGLPDTARRPGGAVRGQGGGRAGLRDRRAAPAAAAAGRAGAQGRARLPVRRGGGHAGQQRGLGEQRAAAGQGHHDGRLPGPDRERAPLPRSARERDVASRFATAFAGDDIDGVVALLTDDAWFTMPPVTLEYQGPAAIAAFLRDIAGWRGPRHYRLVPTRANGQPAFGCYLQEAAGAGIPRARDDRADPGGRPDLGHHPLRRQQQHGAVRAAADARGLAGAGVLAVRDHSYGQTGVGGRFLALGPSVMPGLAARRGVPALVASRRGTEGR